MQNKNIKFHLIIIIAIILLSIATIPKTFQEDTYYLIKVGEYIAENGMEVIEEKIEPFSWHEGLTYTYPHWLFDIILYLVYSMFDIFGIYVFTVLMGILIYLLIYYTNLKICKNNIISAIITISSIYLLQPYITGRAQVVTYICCILTILFIERFLQTGHKTYFIGLTLVPILLANCHAAMFPICLIIYLPYIVAYIFSFLNKKTLYKIKIKRINKTLQKLNENQKPKYTEKLNQKKEKLNTKLAKLNNNLEILQTNSETNKKIIVEQNSNTKWLIVMFIITIFTGLLTPLGDIPYTYTIKSIMGNTMNFIAEHTSVALINFIPLLVIFVIIQVLLFSNKTKIKLADLFMLVGMSLLAIVSYKQFPIFFICVMCIINKLTYILTQNKILPKLDKILQKILTVKGVIFLILIIIIIFLLQYRKIAPQSYVDQNSYPVLATNWIKENIDTENMKLYNDFNYGSYLLFNDIQVFIDGRADVYDPVFNGKQDDIFLDYMQSSSLQVWYDEIFKKYEITHIITTSKGNLNIYLQRNIGYKKLYYDGDFTVYERLELD